MVNDLFRSPVEFRQPTPCQDLSKFLFVVSTDTNPHGDLPAGGGASDVTLQLLMSCHLLLTVLIFTTHYSEAQVALASVLKQAHGRFQEAAQTPSKLSVHLPPRLPVRA